MFLRCIKGARSGLFATAVMLAAAVCTIALPAGSTLPPGALPAFVARPLATTAIALPSLSPFEKWNAILAQARAPKEPRWIELVEHIRRLPEDRRVAAVNDTVNALAYRKDIANWGREDYWASPQEFFARGAGDCEDFAIAKYFLLREAGLRGDQIFLLNYRDPKIGGHMVLVVETKFGAVVLDNLRRGLMPPELYAPHQLIYALNEMGAWWLTRLR